MTGNTEIKKIELVKIGEKKIGLVKTAKKKIELVKNQRKKKLKLN
jgi:hypothetical protein